MSLYLWLFLLAAVCAAFGSDPKWERISYGLSFLCLASFLTLRYAQGTDWLAYNYIFMSAPVTINLNSIYYTEAFHSEFGWKIINNLWRSLGFDFISLSILISVLEMYFLGRFLKRYSPNRALNLVLACPVIYFVYFFSALRQGLVVAVFLGLMLPMLENEQHGKFILLDLLLSTIHSGALALLLLLVVQKIQIKHIFTLIVASVCIGVGLSFVLQYIVSLIGISYETSGANPLALIYRLVIYSITVMLYSGRNSVDTSSKLLFKCYSIGFCIYLVFMSNELISSRLAAPLLAIECALLPALLKGQSRQGSVLLLCIISMCLVMYLKNISAAIDQSKYIEEISVFNYPYISVFNTSDIYHYSTSYYYLSFLKPI